MPFTPFNKGAVWTEAERVEVVRLLRTLLESKRTLWRMCAADRDWSKGVFPTALYLEDDNRFNYWLDELVNRLGIKWGEVE